MVSLKSAKAAVNSATNAIGDILNSISELPNTRLAAGITNRDKQVMTWMLPNGSTVQMYINPENFVINESKQITQTRTKGGFIVQYWGDNLTKLTLSGTTGSSGVKGINLLRDIYRSENRIFQVVAGSQTKELIDAMKKGGITESGLGQKLIPNVAKQLRNRNFILRPSLASLAVGVILFYQGVEYHGFFTSMTITEDVNRLGLFQYSLEFMATETRGSRKNFMAWHREALADDPAGQLLNALTSLGGNAIRDLMGLSPQQVTPMTFHPGSAPLTYGGNSLSSMFGIDATGT